MVCTFDLQFFLEGEILCRVVMYQVYSSISVGESRIEKRNTYVRTYIDIWGEKKKNVEL